MSFQELSERNKMLSSTPQHSFQSQLKTIWKWTFPREKIYLGILRALALMNATVLTDIATFGPENNYQMKCLIKGIERRTRSRAVQPQS